jgi:hypothetical protein
VQAVEGHPSRRYGLTQDVGQPRLTIDGVRLEHTGQGSHWVWCCMPEAPEGSDSANTYHNSTDPADNQGWEGWYWENTVTKAWFGPKKDGKWGAKYGLNRAYWLVNVIGGLVRFQLIKTPKAWCDNSPFLSSLDGRKLHSVLLANSKISTDPKDTVMFHVGQIEGQPLAYGWHSNEDGSEVQAAMDTGNYTRHYRLTIAGGFDGKPKAVKMALLGEGPWAVANAYHCLAFPDYTTQKEVYVKGGGGIPCNAPIHVVFRNGAFIPYNIRLAEGIVGIGPQTGSYSLADNYNTQKVTKGAESLYAGGGEGDWPMGYDASWWDSWVLSWFNPGWESNDLPTLTNTDTSYWDKRITSINAFEWWLDREYYEGVGNYTKPLLIVPFGDCESVVEGKMTGMSYGGLYGMYHWGGSFPKTWTYHKRLVTTTKDDKGNDVTTIGAWEPWGTRVLNDPTADTLQYFPTHGHIVSTSNGDNVATKSMAVKLGGGRTAVIDDPANIYFHPAIGSTGDPSDNPSYAAGTTGASYQFQLGHGPDGSEDWPAGNPVGWA